MSQSSSSYARGGFMYGFTLGGALGTVIGGELLSLFVWWWWIPVLAGVLIGCLHVYGEEHL